jgi:hypothetical protein
MLESESVLEKSCPDVFGNMNQLLPRISARRWSRPIRHTDQLKILCSNTINVGAGRLRDKNPKPILHKKTSEASKFRFQGARQANV